MILCYRGYIPGTVMNEFGYQEAEWINLGVLLTVRVPIYMIDPEFLDINSEQSDPRNKKDKQIIIIMMTINKRRLPNN